MFRQRSQSNICEQEAKFVQERIAAVEKHFADLCNSFAAYTRKAARLRDKNDEVVKTVQAYAESETINRSLCLGLGNFATTLSVLGDYRDAEVHRLDSKVTLNLSQYLIICKNAREDVKNTFSARDKELNRRRRLDKMRERNPRDRQMISQAESDLMKATVEMSRVVKGLEEQIDSFEKRKLHDIKTLLLDFVTIELSFHSKAVELLTKAYQDVAEINEAKDLEEFRDMMRISETIPRSVSARRNTFRQAHSLTSLANRLASSPMINKKTRIIENMESMKSGSTNSSDSMQVEECESSEETETDLSRDNSTRSRLKTL